MVVWLVYFLMPIIELSIEQLKFFDMAMVKSRSRQQITNPIILEYLLAKVAIEQF